MWRWTHDEGVLKHADVGVVFLSTVPLRVNKEQEGNKESTELCRQSLNPGVK